MWEIVSIEDLGHGWLTENSWEGGEGEEKKDERIIINNIFSTNFGSFLLSNVSTSKYLKNDGLAFEVPSFRNNNLLLHLGLSYLSGQFLWTN